MFKQKKTNEELKMQIEYFKIIHGTKTKYGLNKLYPEMTWIHGYGSGIYQAPKEAGISKMAGCKVKGIFDISCPFPAFFAEFKTEKGLLTKEQEDFKGYIWSLRSKGISYKIMIWTSVNQAINETLNLIKSTKALYE